jgi:hypothetical protein
MNALSTHLDDLLAVLRASADLEPSALSPVQLRQALVAGLNASMRDLSYRVGALDDWHTEALADFVAEAHILAEALDRWPKGGEAGETKVG